MVWFPRCWKAAVIAGVFSIVAVAFAQDDTPQPVPLDNEQQAIVAQVIEKVIAGIKTLKGKYPELEHFGDKPWFTQGPGWFRYDYKMKKPVPGWDNAEAAALPGGCGMYFSLAPLYSPASKWAGYYHWGSSGGDRAGITTSFSITSDDPKKGVTDGGLDGAVYQSVHAALENSFEELAAGYVLRKHDVKQDSASIIDALGDGDQDVRYSAVRALAARKLAPEELAAIRDGYTQGKLPATFGFYYMLLCLQAQDAGHMPDFCAEMAKLEIQVETKGLDTFYPTPAVTGPASNARTARECLLEIFAGKDVKPDARFVPAALVILNEDTALRNRLQALDYLSKLSGDTRAQGISAGLTNSFRSVQAKAAEFAGTLHMTGMEKQIEPLLASPSSLVRQAAQEAARKLGLKEVEMNPPRTLPESVTHIADTLWQSGLREQDVVTICAQPEKRVFDRLPPGLVKSALPEGVVLHESNNPLDQNGKIVANPLDDYSLELKDPWRMSSMDAASVKKRGAQFAVGIGKDWIGSALDPTGPFLIAAAMKLNDPATAQAVYERLCDEYETDDDMLDIGLEGLGWELTRGALELFQTKKDDEALKQFEGVMALEKQSRPFTYLSGYVKLAHEVTADIARRKQEGLAPEPVFDSTAACEQYWREKIPGSKERISAMITQLENMPATSSGGSGWDAEGRGYSLVLALAAEGDDAIEPLLDCILHDQRLTRDVEMNMDHGERPVRWVTKVRDEALEALGKMFDKRFLSEENYADFTRGDAATLEKIAEEVRNCREARKK